ncbi:MAG: hypothetical protein ABR964_12420 [Tepidisphaeraceae bacterium]|jgi:hypothetical protein
MTRQLPRNADELVRVLQGALGQRAGPEPIDEEQLALLCEGRIEAIDAEARGRLLEQIAADPAAAQVVAELRALGWGSERGRGDAGTMTLRLCAWAWAAAACLVIALGTWRVMAPPLAAPMQARQISPPPQTTGPGFAVEPNPTNAGEQRTPPPQKVAPTPQPKPAPRAGAWALRDMALVGAAIIVVLLTIPTVQWIRFRKWRGRLDPLEVGSCAWDREPCSDRPR